MRGRGRGGTPAFPALAHIVDGEWEACSQFIGMTLREYAAIKLRVPKSGTDWLDEMILQAKKDAIEDHHTINSAAYRIVTAILEAKAEKPSHKENVEEIDPVLLREIYDLELSVRATNVLKSDGINLIGDLILRSEDELVKIPGMGLRSLTEIKESLAARGLFLRTKPKNW